MLELALLFAALVGTCKALERWAVPLVARHRPGGLPDVSGAGIDPGHDHPGGW